MRTRTNKGLEKARREVSEQLGLGERLIALVLGYREMQSRRASIFTLPFPINWPHYLALTTERLLLIKLRLLWIPKETRNIAFSEQITMHLESRKQSIRLRLMWSADNKLELILPKECFEQAEKMAVILPGKS